ncbi:MAG: chlorohydrolase, partial [Calditrichaeota bacterium]
NSELVRGLVGAHASFTLEDETLTACADLAARWNTGIHIHVAEDPCDAEETRSKYGAELFQRLQRFGILQPRSLLAHNIHLTPAELALARESGAWLLHNPRSNMNNRVGHAAIQHFGNRSAIGTDGFPADMLEETRFGYFKAQEDNSGMAPHKMVAMLHRGNALAGEIFHLPFGAPMPGNVADFVVMDYLPPTPMHEENLAAHVLFGMRAAMVESVMVQGKWIFRNRRWLHIDVQQIYEQAEAAANKLWEKMEKY